MTRDLSARQLVLAAVFLLAALVLLRLPALLQSSPIDDEAVYAVVGDEISAGGVMYRDAVERKPPLLLGVYGLLSETFGRHSLRAVHAVATGWIALTMIGVFLAARGIFDRRVGLTAALLYGLYQQWWYPSSVAFNGEVLMNLPLAWACVTALAFVRHRRAVLMLASGVLIAVAFLLKQPAGIAAVPLVLLPAMLTPRMPPKDIAWQAFVGTFGFCGTLSTVGLWLHYRGLLTDAWYWTVADHDVPHLFWQYALWQSTWFVIACAPITLGAWWSMRDECLWDGRRVERWWLLLLTGVTALGVSASGRFYPHYYIALTLPLSLLAAPFVAAALDAQSAPLSRVNRPVVLTSLVITAAMFLAVQAHGLSRLPASTVFGDYIRAHSAPGDRIFVWGRGTRIYLDADRRPASRFIATFPLTGRIFGTPEYVVDTRSRILPGAWTTLQHEFDQHPPEFIVDLEAGEGARYPMRDFAVLQRWIDASYRPAFRGDGGVIYQRISRAAPS